MAALLQNLYGTVVCREASDDVIIEEISQSELDQIAGAGRTVEGGVESSK